MRRAHRAIERQTKKTTKNGGWFFFSSASSSSSSSSSSGEGRCFLATSFVATKKGDFKRDIDELDDVRKRKKRSGKSKGKNPKKRKFKNSKTSPLRCTDAIDDDAKGENSAAPTKEIGYGALI
jgi:hypothetical protein